MRLHRFLINEEIGEKQEIIISDADLIHQWRNVFRFTTGTQLVLFDNTGFEYLGLIDRISHLGVKVRIISKEDKNNVSYPKVSLYAALIKKDNFEWIIEKATELGVSQIVPVVSDRSEKKGLNLGRAEKIIKEASEQSGRVKLPRLNKPTALEELLESIRMEDEEKIKKISKNSEEKIKFFALDPKGKKWPSNGTFEKEIGVFVGPEGGWTERELQLFKLKKIPIYSLGSQILRAETAVVSSLALLLLI